MSNTELITRLKPFRQTRLGYAVVCIWFFLCLCLCILTGIALVQPTWLEHATRGSLGLYHSCTTEDCQQKPFNLAHALSPYWSTGAVFVIFAVMAFALSMVVIAIWITYREHDANRGFLIAGLLNFLGGFLLILTCILYPMGWNNTETRALCGETADRYHPGQCRVGWTYILVLLASLDAIILGLILLWMIDKEAPPNVMLESVWSPDIDAESDDESNA